MADGQENNLSSEEDGDGQGEPSMEEILSSIRRIISEDDEAEGTKATGEGDADVSDEAAVLEDADGADDLTVPKDVDGAEDAGDEDEDILELTRMVSEDGSVTDLAEERKPEAEMATEASETEATSEEAMAGEGAVDADALEMQDPEPDAPAESSTPAESTPAEATPVEDAPVEVEASPTASEPGGDSLLDKTAAAAATESFGELTKAVIKEDGPGIQLGSLTEKTLEDLLKELLRPMLKEWLDQNLPSITEKLVRKEIERTARRAEEL
ncbi:MAG: hypothetical protein COA65_05840 [Rhodospirillaceae bacterium]|nr:MAG: hypothetical protein COA65_05840 [Rhodospirillaceae bacterium]